MNDFIERQPSLKKLFFKVLEGKKLLQRALNDDKICRHDNICDIYEKVLMVKIPNSLAEERFENLQLEAFFEGTFDLLVSFAYYFK